jgi:hypothetical protein
LTDTGIEIGSRRLRETRTEIGEMNPLLGVVVSSVKEPEEILQTQEGPTILETVAMVIVPGTVSQEAVAEEALGESSEMISFPGARLNWFRHCME